MRQCVYREQPGLDQVRSTLHFTFVRGRTHCAATSHVSQDTALRPTSLLAVRRSAVYRARPARAGTATDRYRQTPEPRTPNPRPRPVPVPAARSHLGDHVHCVRDGRTDGRTNGRTDGALTSWRPCPPCSRASAKRNLIHIRMTIGTISLIFLNQIIWQKASKLPLTS